MRNTSAKGNRAELKVAAYYQERGWLVASRRHIGGAADLIAYMPGEPIHLIEVKASSAKYGAFNNFPPDDRQALASEAERYGGYAYLAWLPNGTIPTLIPESKWP